MHELSLTEKILVVVLETAVSNQAGKVTKVKVEIGELSGVIPDCVATYFGLIARDTLAAGATLEFTTVKAVLYCADCQREFTKETRDFTCPNCGRLGQLTASGRECSVKSIEVE